MLLGPACSLRTTSGRWAEGSRFDSTLRAGASADLPPASPCDLVVGGSLRFLGAVGWIVTYHDCCRCRCPVLDGVDILDRFLLLRRDLTPCDPAAKLHLW